MITTPKFCQCGTPLPPQKTKPKRHCDKCYRAILNERARETYAYEKRILGHPKRRSA